jgi:MFS transporter, DHA2 family, multidrug resistance protein
MNPLATWREWAGLATLALPTLLIGVDMTVLHLAVPRLSADLQPTSTQLLWIVDIYGFLIAGFLLTMGTLGDRIGRRRLLSIGAIAFAFASLLAAYSTSAEMLIVARALLGVAGATLMPSTLSLIRNMFLDQSQRTFAVSVWMMCILTGQAIGPLIGGTLLEYFWWGSAFLIAIPIMVLLLILSPFVLPEYRDPNPGKLDFASVGLSLVMILSIVYGIKDLARYGMSAVPITTIALGIIIGVIFVRRQQTLRDPMLDLSLFRTGSFNSVVATHLLSMFMLAGMQFISAQHLQLVLELPPIQAGMWMVPAAIGGIIGSLLASALVRRMRPVNVIVANLLIGAAGFAVLTQVSIASGLGLLVTGLIIATFAVSLVTALTTDLIISAVPSERAGTASGISETSAEFGIAMGIAVLGSVSTAVYRDRLLDALPPRLSAETEMGAIDTLGGAVAVSEQLSGPLGITLLESARIAFTEGLTVSAAVGGLAMTGLAVLCYVSLRTGTDYGHDTTEGPSIPRVAPGGASNSIQMTARGTDAPGDDD